MGWVPYFAAILSIINTGWNIRRWRVDRKWVAFSYEFTTPDPDTGQARVKVWNSGTTPAYGVGIGVYTNEDDMGMRIAHSIGGFIPAMRPEDDPIVTMFPLGYAKSWRINYQDRPGGKVREELWDATMTQRIDKFSVRERVGFAIAGKNPNAG